MDTTTVEIVSFQFKTDVTEQQINNTHLAVNQLLLAQPGFYYRSLSCDDNGLWFDVVYWKNMSCAKKASDVFMDSDAGQAMLQLIDGDSVTLRYMDAVSEVSCEASAA